MRSANAMGGPIHVLPVIAAVVILVRLIRGRRLLRTIGDRARAEDLVQDVFIRVFRHLHRFDRTRKFSTWIYTIAANLAKTELRSGSRNPVVLQRLLELEDATARPDDVLRRNSLLTVWRGA